VTGAAPGPRSSTTFPAVADVEAVIWDFGGVIAPSPFGALRASEERAGLAPGTLSELLFGTSYAHGDGAEAEPHDWHLLETGELPLQEYVRRLAARSQATLGREISMSDAFGGGASGAIFWPMVHAIRDVKAAGLKTAVLTNNVKEFGGHWRSSIPIELLDVVVDSSEVGLRKPDPRIYLLTAERLGVAPSTCLFLDDLDANVDAAASVGMQTILVGWDAVDVVAAVAELRALLALG
jgi:putative hydrolase of the HAD superfamily